MMFKGGVLNTMTKEQKISHYNFIADTYETLIIGSGAAGLAAAERLYDLGHRNIALVTEHIKAGTSRNTGSDKQTYYKLTLSGNDQDSVQAMTDTLMSGGCIDGDLALCEAALSSRCFLHLVELGVPFPCNRYGEYIGYKTDHDPRHRATSAGPYTSKMMTEALESSILQKEVPILNHLQVIRILQHNQQVCGVLCLDLSPGKTQEDYTFVLLSCSNIIYATGGPAGMYYDSVYPHGHHGSSGLAFEAGATGKNLTEWQYGLASLHPRWNVSGTYMQSLPRFISTDADGRNEKEFLSDFFQSPQELLLNTFLKGYQWPFDVRKVCNGSSIIDILVYMETAKGRKVYLDFTKNPCGGIDFSTLPAEAREYLSKGNACFGTPFQRLRQMNAPALEFYRAKGVDLEQEPLEIALCAQHNNGGIVIDHWWQTNLSGFFCIGEASASHGVYRPGGTALNAGQVGALRAAQYISANSSHVPLSTDKVFELLHKEIHDILSMTDQVCKTAGEDISSHIEIVQKRMSRIGAAFRNIDFIEKGLKETEKELELLPIICHAESVQQLSRFFILRDILISQKIYLYAMKDYIENYGYSRGSALYQNPKGILPSPSLPDTFRHLTEPDTVNRKIQEITCKDNKMIITWRSPRPVPADDDFFENVWKQYRKNKNIY